MIKLKSVSLVNERLKYCISTKSNNLRIFFFDNRDRDLNICEKIDNQEKVNKTAILRNFSIIANYKTYLTFYWAKYMLLPIEDISSTKLFPHTFVQSKFARKKTCLSAGARNSLFCV